MPWHVCVNLHLGLAGGVIVKGKGDRGQCPAGLIKCMPKLDWFHTEKKANGHFNLILPLTCLMKWPKEQNF